MTVYRNGTGGDAIERGPGARARRLRLIDAWARLADEFGVALPGDDTPGTLRG